MRKFFLFCLFVVCFLYAGFVKENLATLHFDNAKDYSITNYIKTNTNLALVYGQTISTDINNIDINAFLCDINANIKEEQTLCDRHIVYAYSNVLKDFVYVNGARVNLQISVDEDRVYIGYPLIMGSF